MHRKEDTRFCIATCFHLKISTMFETWLLPLFRPPSHASKRSSPRPNTQTLKTTTLLSSLPPTKTKGPMPACCSSKALTRPVSSSLPIPSPLRVNTWPTTPMRPCASGGLHSCIRYVLRVRCLGFPVRRRMLISLRAQGSPRKGPGPPCKANPSLAAKPSSSALRKYSPAMEINPFPGPPIGVGTAWRPNVSSFGRLVRGGFMSVSVLRKRGENGRRGCFIHSIFFRPPGGGLKAFLFPFQGG